MAWVQHERAISDRDARASKAAPAERFYSETMRKQFAHRAIVVRRAALVESTPRNPERRGLACVVLDPRQE